MKTMSQVQGVSDIKGITSGVSSIPKALRSSYLELYVLDREISRLESEKFNLDKRRNRVQDRLNNLAGRMEQLHKEIGPDAESKARKVISSKKPLNTMSLKY